MIAKTTWLITCALVLGCVHSASAFPMPTSGYEPAWDPSEWPRLGFVLNSIAGDESDTIYVAGRYESGPGLIAAYNAEGRRLWSKSIYSGSGLDHVGGLDVDSEGNILVAGETYRFGSEAFLAKFNPQGQRLWERHTSSPDNEFGQDVAVDSQGNVYLIGSTTGRVGEMSYGGYDAFVLKYSAGGSLIWAKQYDSEVGGSAHALAIDHNDDLLLVGRIGGTTGATLSTLSPDGDIIWNEYTNYSDISGRGTQTTGIAVDDAGNSYVVGATNMDLGTNASILASDAMLAKHDSDGNLIWQRTIPGSPANKALGVDIGANGNVYITGTTDNTVSGHVHHLVDGFLAGYSSDGDALGYQEFGTDFSDSPLDLYIDGHQRLFVVGSHFDYQGPVYDDYGFIARFDPKPVPEPTSAATLYCLAACGIAVYLRRGRQSR